MSSNFTALGIREELVALLKDSGVTQATPIQDKSIPPLLDGQDVIAQAQTGTGKTLAFALPIMERIKPESPFVQALIITPTRELALQITTEVKKLSTVVGVNVLAAYGGQDVESQVKKLKGAIHIVIGTPGRLLDHLRRGTVQLNGLSMLVLDEADQMLHMGFLKDVEEIISQTPYKKQTMLFSATMPPAIRTLAAGFMRKPLDIQVQSKEKHITLDEIKQVVIETSDREKPDALCLMIDKYVPYLAIVFCRTKRRANTLNALLVERGYNSDELHGDLTQAKREQVMKKFRNAKIQLLVATDVAARGLDIEGITHIFNYDIPHDVESYIHRIGRTGRAGQTGIAFTFVSPTDKPYLQLIEDGIHKRLERTSAEGVPILYKPAKRGDFHKENRESAGRNRRNAGDGRASGASAGGSIPRAGRTSGAGRRTADGPEQSASRPRKTTYGQDRSAAGSERKSSYGKDRSASGLDRKPSFDKDRSTSGQGRAGREESENVRIVRENSASEGNSERSGSFKRSGSTRPSSAFSKDVGRSGFKSGSRTGGGSSRGINGPSSGSLSERPKRDGSFRATQEGGSASTGPKRDGAFRASSQRRAGAPTDRPKRDGSLKSTRGPSPSGGSKRKPSAPRTR